MSDNEFQELLFGDDKPPKFSALVKLSGLSTDESLEFKSAWSDAPEPFKLDIMAKLAGLSEDNLELNFSGVFRASLEDDAEEVRAEATRGLWECEDRAIIRPLIELVTHDPSARVRAAAAVSLARFADMAQEGKLRPQDSQRVLETLLSAINRQGEDGEVRRRAIEAVANYDLPEIDKIVVEAYESGEDKLEQSAIFAMGRTSNPKWLPKVLAAMDDDNAAIRYEAATACGLLGDESTAPHLIHLIQDEDLQVQIAAIKALGAVGGTLAKRALQQCLKIGEDALEEAATESLAHLEFDDDPLSARFEL